MRDFKVTHACIGQREYYYAKDEKDRPLGFITFFDKNCRDPFIRVIDISIQFSSDIDEIIKNEIAKFLILKVVALCIPKNPPPNIRNRALVFTFPHNSAAIALLRESIGENFFQAADYQADEKTSNFIFSVDQLKEFNANSENFDADAVVDEVIRREDKHGDFSECKQHVDDYDENGTYLFSEDQKNQGEKPLVPTSNNVAIFDDKHSAGSQENDNHSHLPEDRKDSDLLGSIKTVQDDVDLVQEIIRKFPDKKEQITQLLQTFKIYQYYAQLRTEFNTALNQKDKKQISIKSPKINFLNRILNGLTEQLAAQDASVLTNVGFANLILYKYNFRDISFGNTIEHDLQIKQEMKKGILRSNCCFYGRSKTVVKMALEKSTENNANIENKL